MSHPIDLHVRVEPLLLSRSESGSLSGELWVECGPVAFPKSHWNDLLAAVLGWWSEATVSLVDGRKRNVRTHFWDGPFEVRMFAKRRDCWQAECVERRVAGMRVLHEVEFAPDPYVDSLLSCSDGVLQRCVREGGQSSDLETVTRERERLIHYLAKNRGR